MTREGTETKVSEFSEGCEHSGGTMPELVLHPNIQFIYELALAGRELEALGVKAPRLDVPGRAFRAEELDGAERLRKRVAYFRTVDGELTDYHHIQAANRTRSVNQYLTHWIYPYKGKYHPQMVRALLNVLKLEAGVDYDHVFAGLTGSRMSLVDKQAGRTMNVDFDENFELMTVYAPDGSEFVCIEPWTRGLGAFGELNKPGWESGELIPVIKPGETKTLRAVFGVEL